MFERIAGRALVPVGVVVTGFLVVCFTLLYSAIREVVIRDAIGQANNLAGIVLKSTRSAMMKPDREMNNAIIQNISEQKGVQHVRIFNEKGVVAFSSRAGEVSRQVDKKAEGCVICHEKTEPVKTLGNMQKARTFTNSLGQETLAITAPIYNEPACSEAACHVHPSSQTVLGTLDIGLAQDATVNSLSVIRAEMIIFSLLALVLTTAGVIALLKMIVLAPLNRLQAYTERREQDDTVPQPANLPYELDKIAKSYYVLSNKLTELEKRSGLGSDTPHRPEGPENAG